MLNRAGRSVLNVACYAMLAAALSLTACGHLSKTPGFEQSEKKSRDGKEPSAEDKRKFDHFFFEGVNAKLKGNTVEALERFQKCLNLAPNNPASTYEIADILHKAGRHTEALTYAKKAASLDETNIWYQLLYCDCLRELSRYNDAIAVYQKTIKNFPDKIDLYYELASCFLYASKPEEAVKVYDKIEDRIGIT
jgi:tetratricopeptide (TPR) repeat protein